METEHIIPLSMAFTMYSLLLLLTSPPISSYEFVTKSKVCSDHIAYTSSHGHDHFYINGISVEKALFCKAIQTYYANGCILEGDLGINHCVSGVSLVDFPLRTGRKILQKESRDKSSSYDREEKNDSASLSVTKKAALVAAGMFFMSCVYAFIRKGEKMFPKFFRRTQIQWIQRHFLE